MARSKAASRRDTSAELDSLKDQLEHLAALVDRYRDDKDASIAADVVAKAREFISRATQTTTNAAEESVDAIVTAGRDLAESARGSATDAVDDLGKTISRNPLTAALAAAGIGMVVGLIMRRD